MTENKQMHTDRDGERERERERERGGERGERERVGKRAGIRKIDLRGGKDGYIVGLNCNRHLVFHA